jgi:hypothetical protein
MRAIELEGGGEFDRGAALGEEIFADGKSFGG